MNRPNLTVIHIEARDLFNETITALKDRAGFFSGETPTIPAYFIAATGVMESSAVYQRQLDALRNQTLTCKRPFLTLADGMEALNDKALIESVSKVLADVQGPLGQSVEPMVEKLLMEPSIKPLNISKDALLTIIHAYLIEQPSTSNTQLKNFVSKQIGWYQKYMVSMIDAAFGSADPWTYNPLFIYFGPIKSHTAYFLYFSWLSGVDVLYLNASLTPKPMVLQKRAQNLSWHTQDTAFEFKVWKQDEPLPSYDLISSSEDALSAVVKYKTSDDIFRDFGSYISDRSGFIRGEVPILPVYFYRIIGIQINQNLYFNELFKLDRKLKSRGQEYVRFENSIPLKNDPVFLKAFSPVWQKYQTGQVNDLDPLLDALSSVSAFPLHHKSHYRKLLVSALKATLLEYVTEDLVSSIGQIKNLIMKLLIWTQQYLVEALNDFEFSRLDQGSARNPKILYYGGIKKHEAYFLLFASRLGADVIYFNTYEDTPWDQLLNDHLKSFKVQFPERCRIQPFPTKEIHMRSETTAYQATKEIESVLFDPEGGLFKPWQLDPFKVKSVSLRSTLEEAQTLWPIEARLREHFEVKEDTVYIPNLFFKVSGIHSDKNAYWQLMASFHSEKLVKLIPALPFTKEEHSKTDAYLVNYILDSTGLLDTKEVQKKQIYKYQHLKTETQQMILDTINKVLASKAYKAPLDQNQKKTVLLTLLNLPTDLLNLITSFDKPFNIPKLVIYDPNEQMFSDADVATLLFLHLIGFDIALFTPTGYNNIENVLKADYYDVYRLAEVDFNLPLPDLNQFKPTAEKGKSFLSSLFGL